jgi:hypothetical protein
MAPETNSEPLPPLYEKWIAELVGGAIPRESRATCDNCAMCAAKQPESSAQTYYFDPVIKCCTWVPNLPNFLVGRILSEAGPSDVDPAAQFGRATVEKRIAGGIGVSPLGLAPSPVFSLLYRNSSESFGRSRSLSCPHYIEDGGRCGIWRNRNSTCSTWFCKHVRGQVGFTFWRDSLHQLLQIVERALARWCLLELPFDDAALRHLVVTDDWTGDADTVTGASLDNRVDRSSYARIWGRWRGREHEFFARCAELVSPLSWTDALAIGGPEARAYARLTHEAYGRLISDDVPSPLKMGPFHLVQIENAMTRVNTYSVYDPLDVPQAVMDLLHYFDGRPTESALAAIAGERGVRLDPALIRKLVDFKLLVAAEGPN